MMKFGHERCSLHIVEMRRKFMQLRRVLEQVWAGQPMNTTCTLHVPAYTIHNVAQFLQEQISGLRIFNVKLFSRVLFSVE